MQAEVRRIYRTLLEQDENFTGFDTEKGYDFCITVVSRVSVYFWPTWVVDLPHEIDYSACVVIWETLILNITCLSDILSENMAWGGGVGLCIICTCYV